MNHEAQRIAIAEACGWKLIPHSWKTESGVTVTGWKTLKPDGTVSNGAAASEVSARWNWPSYLSDLNAMHEAEKVLGSQQAMNYFESIRKNATATQRAEAFLRAVRPDLFKHDNRGTPGRHRGQVPITAGHVFRIARICWDRG